MPAMKHPNDKTARRSRVWKIQTKKTIKPSKISCTKIRQRYRNRVYLSTRKEKVVTHTSIPIYEKIPWYMKDNKPVIEKMKDDVKLQTSMKKMKSLNRKLLTQLLSPRKLRSKTKLKSPVDVKTEVGVKRRKKGTRFEIPKNKPRKEK